jgi:hypothetical protein
MERHAWAPSIELIEARAFFSVADVRGGILRNDMASSIITAPRKPTPHGLLGSIARSSRADRAAPSAEHGSRRQQTINGTNKRSTPSNKEDATLKVTQGKAGLALELTASDVGLIAGIASQGSGRSHLASTTRTRGYDE